MNNNAVFFVNYYILEPDRFSEKDMNQKAKAYTIFWMVKTRVYKIVKTILLAEIGIQVHI